MKLIKLNNFRAADCRCSSLTQPAVYHMVTSPSLLVEVLTGSCRRVKSRDTVDE